MPDQEKLTELRVEFGRFKTVTEQGLKDVSHKAKNALGIAQAQLETMPLKIEEASKPLKVRLEKLELADQKHQDRIHEFATNFALMGQGNLALKEHIETLKEDKKALAKDLAQAKKEAAEWREGLAWRMNLLLLGMLGTTIGWIATAVIK